MELQYFNDPAKKDKNTKKYNEKPTGKPAELSDLQDGLQKVLNNVADSKDVALEELEEIASEVSKGSIYKKKVTSSRIQSLKALMVTKQLPKFMKSSRIQSRGPRIFIICYNGLPIPNSISIKRRK